MESSKGLSDKTKRLIVWLVALLALVITAGVVTIVVVQTKATSEARTNCIAMQGDWIGTHEGICLAATNPPAPTVTMPEPIPSSTIYLD